MSKQITLEEALQLVSFELDEYGDWHLIDVHTTIHGLVNGDVSNIKGDVITVGGDVGTVGGNVGNVVGTVYGNISGREWQFTETPKDKLKRLIKEGASKDELLEAFNQLEDNND